MKDDWKTKPHHDGPKTDDEPAPRVVPIGPPVGEQPQAGIPRTNNPEQYELGKTKIGAPTPASLILEPEPKAVTQPMPGIPRTNNPEQYVAFKTQLGRATV